MHRKQEVDLLPLDTKIERTLKNMRNVTNADNRRMDNLIERLQAIPEEEEAKRPMRPNTMEYF